MRPIDASAAATSATSEALAEPRYLVLGAGGLGCPALMGLVAGGARHLVVVDDDSVDASNLHRQLLFDLSDVGAPKALAARHRLLRGLPDLRIRALTRRIDGPSLERLLDELGPDTVVLECSDSPALKFEVNDRCTRRGTALVIGGVIGWTGQAMAIAPGGPCYRCLFEAPPPARLAPACAQAGVMGAVAGHVGWIMAAAALQLAAGAPGLAGLLTVIDGRTLAPRQLQPPPRAGCPACGATPVDRARVAP